MRHRQCTGMLSHTNLKIWTRWESRENILPVLFERVHLRKKNKTSELSWNHQQLREQPSLCLNLFFLSSLNDVYLLYNDFKIKLVLKAVKERILNSQGCMTLLDEERWAGGWRVFHFFTFSHCIILICWTSAALIKVVGPKAWPFIN